jgi:hypothetical protein
MKANEVKVNADGSWTVETTNMVHGMLEQGGITGRIVSVSPDTLRRLGVDGEPDGRYNDLMTNIDRVRSALDDGLMSGVKVVSKGHTIR